MNESETRAELIETKLMEALLKLTSPEGELYVNGGHRPSKETKPPITSPERA